MKMGSSKIDVTPNYPIPLAGFAHREGVTESIFSPISIRTFIYKAENTSVLWVIGDFIWWDEHDVWNWKNEIAERFQLTPAHIVFHATHNHSGPQLSSRFSKLLGVRNEAYIKQLYQSIMQSVEDSIANTNYVECKVYKGLSKIGVSRRKKVDSVVQMAPNRDIEIDNELRVIMFVDKLGINRAMFISLACHPTITDDNKLSGEFPGYVCEKLEEAFPECHVAFLQGFGGDIRPDLTKSEKFFKGTVTAIKQKGEQLYKEILDTIKTTCAPFSVQNICVIEKEYSLFFQQHVNSPPIPKGLKKEAHKLKEQIFDYKLRFQLIVFHEKLKFFTANAEMVHAYGKYLKSMDPSITPIGYSNGMIGYIPTYTQLLEGGYESEDSIYYFGYPHKVALETESQLQKLWQNMIYGE